MKNFQIIKEGAKRFWKNPILGLPSLLQIIANYIPIIIILVIIALIAGVSAITFILNPETISVDALDKVLLLATVLLALLVFVLLAINSFFNGMLLGMIKSGKRKLDFGSGKKFWPRIFCFDLLLGGYILLAVAIVAVTSLLTEITMWLAVIPVLFSIAFLLSLPLFLLGAYYIVINDLGIKEALRKSCKTIWKNYLKFLGLLIILILITIAIVILLGWIPVAGAILMNILVMTYLKICLYLFASGRA